MSPQPPREPRRAPLNLACRNPRGLRMCLTNFSGLSGDDTLDWRKVAFVDVGVWVLLHHLVRALRPGNLYILPPTQTGVRAYFNQRLGEGNARGSGLPPDGGPAVEVEVPRFSIQSPNRFCLQKVRSKFDLSARLADWRAMLIHNYTVDEETARGFSSTMAEIMINSFDHGRSEGGCILGGQNFPQAGHSILATADWGLTIPTTLRQSGRFGAQVRSDHEWILMSLEKGVTAKTHPRNLGVGLFELTRMVRANGGGMTVISGEGLVSIRGGGDPKGEPLGRRYGRFGGTMILLDLQGRA